MTIAPHRQQPKGDYITWLVALGAVALSVVSYVVSLRTGNTLNHGDTIAHLEISRRVFESPTPGLAQLGNVWLPLPHLLMLPFIWVDPLYHSGFAGSVVSMIAYVITVVLAYKITQRLTGRKFAGVVAAGIFAVNANMLYMQTTPMTEALLYCTIAGAVYCLQQWADTRKAAYLAGAGGTSLLATLTRYESWPIVVCLFVSISLIAWSQKLPSHGLKLTWNRIEDRAIVFAVMAFAGIVGWVVYNQAIFGNALEFQNGEYAKPSLWVYKGEPAIGNWVTSAKTYWYAIVDCVGLPALITAIVGLAALLVMELRHKRAATRTLPVLSILLMVPFFIISLYTGQRPLHVMEINGGLYNIRFALIMLLPVAVFIGYLVGVLQRFKPVMYAMGVAILAGAVFVSGTSLLNGSVVTFEESKGNVNVAQQDVADWFKSHYNGGEILMMSFGNEDIAFTAPSEKTVYEGSYRLWEQSISDPVGNHIKWIVIRCGKQPDMLCKEANKGKLSLTDYNTVFQAKDDTYRIYKLKSA